MNLIPDNTAVIRDSYHGWMVTVKLDALISWLTGDEYFIQVNTKPEEKSNLDESFVMVKDELTDSFVVIAKNESVE